jgi:hypothetical protein
VLTRRNGNFSQDLETNTDTENAREHQVVVEAAAKSNGGLHAQAVR